MDMAKIARKYRNMTNAEFNVQEFMEDMKKIDEMDKKRHAEYVKSQIKKTRGKKMTTAEVIDFYNSLLIDPKDTTTRLIFQTRKNLLKLGV